MKAAAFSEVPFLHGAEPKAIAAVKRAARPMSVTAGTVLFRTGDPGDACYFVEAGALEVADVPGGAVLATLGPGALVGELAVLLGEQRSATVTAVADADLAVLTRADLNLLMDAHPSIALAFSRELGRRVVRTNRRFVGERNARRSLVWPPERVGPLAEGIMGYDRRVGVGVVAGARVGNLPGVSRVRGPHYGADDPGLDAVLVCAGGDGSDRAAKLVAGSDHVLCFAPPPPWLRDAAPLNRLVRLPDSPLGLRRAVRWASGRAVGLALSSGGSKAVAHIGVVGELREAGVEVDAVAGSSGGAIAAAGVAFDKGLEVAPAWVGDLARATRLARLDLNIPPRTAVAKGRRLRKVFTTWGIGPRIEDASIPLWLVGSDVATGESVVMREGDLADAMRASLSVPIAFDPWPVGDRLVMDGAVANPLPTDVLRAGGVGIVLASNVAGQDSIIPTNGRLPGVGQLFGRVLNAMERERIKTLLPLADVVIRPNLSRSATFDFSDVDGFIAAGAQAARDRLADVRSLLAAASGHAVGTGSVTRR